jgi:glycolate oxidase FAD binding subunit
MSEIEAAVREAQRPWLAVGAGTKPALSGDETLDLISLRRWRGILEYEPTEYTFTAKSGTPLIEVSSALAEQGQYLPFDPLLISEGATLGGTIAAAANGPGRIRFGGVRDFLVGMEFLNGHGTRLIGGGKVVKNAAGFDFPKLFCGALGRFGLMTEVTFKVFPKPRATCTLEISAHSLNDAIERLVFALGTMWEVEAIELLPPHTLRLRLAGEPEALDPRVAKLQQEMDRPARILDAAETTAFWQAMGSFAWAAGCASLVKVPLTPRRIAALDSALGEAPRRYSAGGQVAWIGWTEDLEPLHRILQQHSLTGLLWRGRSGYLGAYHADALTKRIAAVFDPTGRIAPAPPLLFPHTHG